MKNRNVRNRGFTLVELIMGIFIISIMAITTGTMLYHTSLNWQRDMGAVDLQREMALAMHMLSIVARPGTAEQIDASGSTLTIGNESFFLNADTLWYDPDTSTNNDEIEIIGAGVTGLSFTQDLPTHSINVNMVLQGNTETITLDSVINYRN